MKISIFGMGYVGAVSAACLARMGHEVIGVDVNRGKIDLINNGASPVMEEGLAELIAEAYRAGRISATDDPIEAVQKSEISLISVGTPTGAVPNDPARWGTWGTRYAGDFEYYQSSQFEVVWKHEHVIAAIRPHAWDYGELARAFVTA